MADIIVAFMFWSAFIAMCFALLVNLINDVKNDNDDYVIDFAAGKPYKKRM